MDFENISYLKAGNQKQKRVYQVLTKAGILVKLARYSPLLTGTIPIQVDTEESDLDIICCWTDKRSFSDCLTANFSRHKNFERIERPVNGVDTVIAHFIIDEFTVEIFGQNKQSKEQEAYRHMIIEYKLLLRYGEDLRQTVIQLKRKGLKTEPAFAKALGLAGDPYAELLKLKE